MLLLCLQACVPATQIEDMAIINMRGVDIVEQDGKKVIETTIVPFIFDPVAQETTNILISRGNLVKEARENAGKQSSKVLTPGKINVEIYGKEAAESGIIPFLNTLLRDARVSDRMQLVITNGTAKELLEVENESISINTSEYMQELVEKEVKQDMLPQNTLEYFTRLTEQLGIDPLLPIIDVVDGWPTLVGAGLFLDDKYVGSISLQESFLINQMRKKVRNTRLSAEIPAEKYEKEIYEKYKLERGDDKIHLFLRLDKGKAKLKIIDIDTLKFKAEIKMSGEVLETSILMDMKTNETIQKMEKDIAAFFEKEYEKLFAKLQEVNSDAFGLGRKYHSTRKGSDITVEDWKKMYPDTKVEFEVDFTIVNFGTIN